MWMCMCVPGLGKQWRRTHRIWLWSDADGPSGPLQRSFTAQTSHTHSMFPSCISGAIAFFFLSDEQRCDMSSPPSPRRPRHPQGQPAQKMETFKMINHTCLRNNRINLDCSLLVGAEVLESPPEAFRFFVNWVMQLNKMAFEQTRLKHIMCFPFSPPK